MKNNKKLILCEGDILDNQAYMNDTKFKEILYELETNEVKERDSYDAVFHLVTAAKGIEESYSLTTNIALTE